MSSAIKILPHYTYEDYIQWEGRWEIIEGIPYAMSPLPVPEHQRIAGNLFTEFRLAFKKCGKRCRAYQPIDYKVQDDTIIQPDMLVVCGSISKKFLDFAPALVAEILSPSTALKDRHTKYSIYQKEQVNYYLIISPDSKEVEVYELDNNEYRLKQKGSDIKYNFNFEGCEVEISFKEIWE